jgi:signal peptidase II
MKKGTDPFSGSGKNGLRWLWLTAVVVIIDQLTKAWVNVSVALYQRIEILPFLDITHMRNTGAAFSFLSRASGWQRWFFTAVALSVSTALVLWLRRLPPGQNRLAAGLALILGGALGNVWDRLQSGQVVDFIYVYYQSWYWPAFNVADSAITVGAGLLILDALASRRKGAV